jgi:hypothetical protein
VQDRTYYAMRRSTKESASLQKIGCSIPRPLPILHPPFHLQAGTLLMKISSQTPVCVPASSRFIPAFFRSAN